jgi:hypothetical protein
MKNPDPVNQAAENMIKLLDIFNQAVLADRDPLPSNYFYQ